jgi:hypothetical protein
MKHGELQILGGAHLILQFSGCFSDPSLFIMLIHPSDDLGADPEAKPPSSPDFFPILLLIYI